MARAKRTIQLAVFLSLALAAMAAASSAVMALPQHSTPAQVTERPASAVLTQQGAGQAYRLMGSASSAVAGSLGFSSATTTSTIFADGFEGSAAWQYAGSPTWAPTTYRAATGSRSAYCAGSTIAAPGPYANNMKAWIYAGPFNLSAVTASSLLYKLYLNSSDEFKTMVSVDGSNFYGWGVSGNSQGWVDRSIDLKTIPTLGSVCGRSQVWIAFVFKSDASRTAEGAYIDDVQLLNTNAPTDTTPPVTTVTGGGTGWFKNPVTLTFTATDSGSDASGVDYTMYRVDSGSFVKGQSVTIAAPSGGANDGVHTVDYYSADKAGNIEATKSVTVNIDTTKPTTAALNAVNVKRGRTATLKFRISEPTDLSPSAKVVLKVKTAKTSRTVMTKTLNGVPMNVQQAYSFRATFKKGSYKWYVYAVDLAGNVQSKVASRSFTVK
jgi:hypothetical protein